MRSPPRRRRRPLARAQRALLGALLLAFALLAVAPAFAKEVIPAGLEPRIVDLLADVDATALPAGLQLGDIAVEGHGIEFGLLRDGHQVGSVAAGPVGGARSGDVRSTSFALRLVGGDDPASAQWLAAMAASIQARDQGGFYREVEPGPGEQQAQDGVPTGPRAYRPLVVEHVEGEFVGCPLSVSCTEGWERFQSANRAAIPVLLLAAMVAWRRRTQVRIEPHVRATHLLPVVVQLLLYGYWAIWWQPVAGHAAMLLYLVVFAFALDGLLGVAREGVWRPSPVVVPIVLSANLFAWQSGPWSWTGVLVIALAVASRQLLRRDGHHVFNPSALGLAILGIAATLAPETVAYGDVSLRLNSGPNAAEVIFLLALLPQLRVPVVLVTLGAAAGLVVGVNLSGVPAISPVIPQGLLLITLFATDPATIPRTGPGKLLWGGMLGLAIVLVTGVTIPVVGTDFFAKMFPIALLNPLAPWADRVAARLPEKLRGLLDARRNRAHVAVWIAFVLLHIGTKTQGFDGRMHREQGTPTLVYPAAGPATLDDNPAWGRAFTLQPEVARLRRLLGGTP